MSLVACQLDPRRQHGTFTLRSAERRDDGLYALLLDDSVLYPEGGGQPADHGTVGGVEVVDVQLVEGGVLHVAVGPVEPGPVEVAVDWTRRFDHMQQHSAQHLLSALAEDRLRLKTVGFHLGAALSTIDLDGALSDKNRDRLQAWANEEIRADRAVGFRTVTVEEYADLDVRSRGLPDDHQGPVRLVEIEGIDLNTCGGTHVARLGELQLVHLVRTERNKGGTRLHFVAGGRALAALDAAREREQGLTRALTCGPEEHLAAVERLLVSNREAARTEKRLLGELGELLGAALAQGGSDEDLRHLHRPEADMGLLQRIGQAAQAARPEARLVLTGGEGEGVFLVLGPDAWVAELGPRLAAAVDGRGGGRGGRFQGKGAAMQGAVAVLDGEG